MGMLYMAAASMLFICMHTGVRYISQVHHPFETAFFRASFGLIVLIPMFWSNGLSSLKTGSYGLLAVRGGLNGVAMLCFFTGVSLTPLAEVAALGFTAPIFAIMLAVLFLGEKIRMRRWAAIIIGFLGTVVVLRPGFVEIGLGPILIIVSSLVWAVALMVIKVLTRTVSSLAITAYSAIALTPITLIAAYPYWEWPNAEGWAVFLFIGLVGTVAQTLMNQSFKLADASIVLPVEFTKLIWASLFGFALFGEIPDIFTYLGALMIFGSTTYIALRSAKLSREKAAAARAEKARDKSHG